MNNLTLFGWDEFFEKQFQNFSGEEFSAGRVIRENKNNYIVATESGDLTGELSGKFYFNTENKSDFPAVGDWVILRPLHDEGKGIIESIMQRKSKFSRKTALNKTDEQIIASNIDFIFLVTSLNLDTNPRRIERYLTLAYESNITPVIVLSKSDLCENIDDIYGDIKFIAGDTDICVVSAYDNSGIEQLNKYFSGNRTVAFVGSSGVGKSTLINLLSGKEIMAVRDISTYKDKGRHTTSHRELTVLPNGGIIIDTPGMRELQMWEGSEGISETFSDIENYISMCRFSDCSHSSEPGCAVKSAIENGELDEDRYRNFIKLQKEIRYFENRNNRKAALSEKKKWKKITAEAKKNNKQRFK